MTSWPYVNGPSPGALSIPRTGLQMLIKKDPATGLLLPDSIGLSISDKPNVRTEIWALLFDEFDEPYSDEQRIINIEASAILNNGWELVGNSTKGYAVYEEGSDMQRPYRYFGEILIEGWQWSDGSNMQWSDGSNMESGS